MPSDLFVPFFAGRALHEVRALQDGVLPHPVLDADDRLLQTLLLVQLRLFLGFLFFQHLVIGEKIRLVGVLVGRDVVLADDVVRHDRDPPDQQIRIDAVVVFLFSSGVLTAPFTVHTMP